MVQIRKPVLGHLGGLSDIDRALAVLAGQGVHPGRARAALGELARERHISLSQCASLVAGSLNGSRN
ncbi:hypothetical protein [Amycolatopsis sp. PS_44_ISF1]|uniref:hypothetical protein n=1 Tax=Amycolatopsis sp. PS_44_ISF1 TaxID=2974917 RepID=UPI0028DE1501|nr:hypothetical protein [Amycolatopsis sp. PS_44_ISF1]MDT8914489.1 hypothetical protein [Amycolatopsis sp. PS_44_ISF1]